MVCRPSASFRTSSAELPYTIFQYWLLAMGIPLIEKYLFSTSNDAVLPPLRQVTTAAPTFMVLSTLNVLKNSLSMNEIAPPAGDE